MLLLFLFSIIYLYICNFFQIQTFLSALINRKYKITVLEDKWITETIRKKTGLKLKKVIIFEDKKPYGMMPGIPLWPEMILSRGLYQTFNKDELEWVILHEAGHCVLWHVVKGGIIQFIFLLAGLYIINLFHFSLIPTFCISLFLGFCAVQVLRRMIEYEADKFSIDRVTNPRGVITAQNKFRKAYQDHSYNSTKSVIRFLFHWNIYPSERIKMAKLRLG